LDFCADGIDAAVGLISKRLDDAAEQRHPPG
jgi:hypothetical protein